MFIAPLGPLSAPLPSPSAFEVGADRRFRDPFAISTEAEECPEDAEALSFRARPEFQRGVEEVDGTGEPLVDHHVPRLSANALKCLVEVRYCVEEWPARSAHSRGS